MSSLARIIDGKALAQKVRAQVRAEVERMRAALGVTPHLAVILASNDPASAVYVKNKGKAAEEAGIRATQHTLAPETSREALLALVDQLSADPDVDGILVQLPLPSQHDSLEVIQHIGADKDVDGLTEANAGRLSRGDEGGLIPCTPLGCVRLLDEAGVNVAGKEAVVLGRSRLVGRPVAELLTNRNATVTICHSKTRHLGEHIRRADILIAAIGKHELVKGRDLKPGAVVIDVGINRDAQGKLVGDVCFHSARERASAITPVPGGVGPMTIACLLENTHRAARMRRGFHGGA